MARARVLLVGLDPDIVDYTKSPVPGLTAAKVRAAVETDRANLETLGYSVRSLYVDDGKTAEAVLTERTHHQYIRLHHDRCGSTYCSAVLPVVREVNQHSAPACPSFDEDMLQLKSSRHCRSCKALGLDRWFGYYSNASHAICFDPAL